MTKPKHFIDPRYYQISMLSLFLVYGILRLDFEIAPSRVVLFLLTTLFTQFICTRLWKLPRFDPRSPFISGLSLCLLLRTNDPFLAAAAAVIAIASKFIFHRNGKHLFNPVNFSLVAMILLTDGVWVSPGQWGTPAFFGFLMACLGGLVINRAARSDVTYAFLTFYLLILFGRAAWLGQPWTIPFHHLQSGAFLLFTFFMISDPRTTPDSRSGRILFSFLVAAGAGGIHFILFQPNGLIFSLAFFYLLTPLIDRFLPGNSFQWAQSNGHKNSIKHPSNIGGSHETQTIPAHRDRLLGPHLDRNRLLILRFLRREGRNETIQPGLPGGPRAA